MASGFYVLHFDFSNKKKCAKKLQWHLTSVNVITTSISVIWNPWFIFPQLHENWKFHKPRVASYWLVKLDSIKRRKVIDIVRSNVRAVLQRTWKSPDVDSLRLYRIFSRVFNRLLWSHGQGLWNCFQSSGYVWFFTVFVVRIRFYCPVPLLNLFCRMGTFDFQTNGSSYTPTHLKCQIYLFEL